MRDIERRALATQATERRFRDRPFDWSKAATCIHLVRFHAAQLGHQLPVVPKFRTPLSAMKALKATGHDSLPALMDAYFDRVPPAFLRVGDMLALPGDGGFHSLVIKGSQHKYLGWHEDAEGCTIMEIDVTAADGAWRL
jgi:hypothetical protein